MPCAMRSLFAATESKTRSTSRRRVHFPVDRQSGEKQNFWRGDIFGGMKHAGFERSLMAPMDVRPPSFLFSHGEQRSWDELLGKWGQLPARGGGSAGSNRKFERTNRVLDALTAPAFAVFALQVRLLPCVAGSYRVSVLFALSNALRQVFRSPEKTVQAAKTSVAKVFAMAAPNAQLGGMSGGSQPESASTTSHGAISASPAFVKRRTRMASATSSAAFALETVV